MQELESIAMSLGMAVLVEVHDAGELDRALTLKTPLLGINNRDLRTFKVDLGTTLRVTELIEDKDILVSESGIHSAEHIKKLSDAGVRAVLVGESLMRSADIAAKIKEMFYP